MVLSIAAEGRIEVVRIYSIFNLPMATLEYSHRFLKQCHCRRRLRPPLFELRMLCYNTLATAFTATIAFSAAAVAATTSLAELWLEQLAASPAAAIVPGRGEGGEEGQWNLWRAVTLPVVPFQPYVKCVP